MAREKQTNKNLGLFIKKARTDQKLTYEELAEMSGILHMADPSGRFCGREWPRSGASGRIP